MGRPTAVPPTCGRPCWTRQSLVIRCLLVPCARILSRGKSLLGLRAGRAGREPTFMRRDRILYHAFRKFAASRPKAMKKPLSPVIASVAKQSPGRYGDCFAACGGSQCNGRKFSTATVENFLPQQGWGRVEEFKFPEVKIHYPRRAYRVGDILSGKKSPWGPVRRTVNEWGTNKRIRPRTADGRPP